MYGSFAHAIVNAVHFVECFAELHGAEPLPLSFRFPDDICKQSTRHPANCAEPSYSSISNVAPRTRAPNDVNGCRASDNIEWAATKASKLHCCGAVSSAHCGQWPAEDRGTQDTASRQRGTPP